METTIHCINSEAPYNMTKIIKYLNEIGFKMNPTVRDGAMFCSETDESYNPEELSVVGSFRFDDFSSDPEDVAVLYAIEAKNGARALLADSFGPYADPEVAEFVGSLKDERQSSRLMENIPPQKTVLINAN